MKKQFLSLSLILSLCLILSRVCIAQSTESEQKIPTTTLSFVELEYNWGEVDAGEKVLNIFTFTNTGDEPLLLSNAKGSCGCTVPNWPKQPIAPGESGEIVVVFDSKGKKNLQSKRVTITANTEPAQTFLTMKGIVLPAESTDQELKNKNDNLTEDRDKAFSKNPENSIAIFPNPTTDLLKVKLKDFAGETATIGIFSDSGQRLYTQSIPVISTDHISINVSDYSAGTYLISILIAGKERVTKPFSVVR